jgi:hypothetical protein
MTREPAPAKAAHDACAVTVERRLAAQCPEQSAETFQVPEPDRA